MKLRRDSPNQVEWFPVLAIPALEGGGHRTEKRRCNSATSLVPYRNGYIHTSASKMIKPQKYLVMFIHTSIFTQGYLSKMVFIIQIPFQFKTAGRNYSSKSGRLNCMDALLLNEWTIILHTIFSLLRSPFLQYSMFANLRREQADGN